MKRLFTLFFSMTLAVLATHAQEALKRVYNESIDPMEQIDEALTKAKADDKFVCCQVGGNWCPWCLRFADFVEKDTAVNKAMNDNYVYIHVNYNPRKTAGADVQKKSELLMRRLGNPQRFGFPVFVLLDADGSVLHIQDSSFLEEGKGYSTEKTLRFLQNWTPKAVKK